MGQVAMTVLSLKEAVERTGTSKIDIWRAIQAGALSAKKTDDGGFAMPIARRPVYSRRRWRKRVSTSVSGWAT